jgi:hypothetical protein
MTNRVGALPQEGMLFHARPVSHLDAAIPHAQATSKALRLLDSGRFGLPSSHARSQGAASVRDRVSRNLGGAINCSVTFVAVPYQLLK